MTNKYKILIFAPTPPPYAGPEVSTELLLHCGLEDHFNLVHIRANFNRDNASKGLINRNNLKAASWLLPGLIYRLIKERPHILYANLSQTRVGLVRDAFVVEAGRLAGTRVVMHLRGSNFDEYYRKGSALDRIIARYVCKRVNTFIVLADCLRNQFESVLPGGYRVETVYNAVRPLNFLPDIERYEQLRAYRQDRLRIPRVLFVGHHSFNKGYFDFLEAAELVASRIGRVRFTSAGQRIIRDPLKVQKRPLARSSGSIGKGRIESPLIEHKGMIWGTEKTHLFLDSDIFVLPSYSEGMPIALLEAMSAGLPAIVTPVGAIPEFFRDGENGIVVPMGEPRAIAAAIIRLVEEKQLTDDMGRRNFLLCRSLFTPDRLAADMRRVFRDALN